MALKDALAAYEPRQMPLAKIPFTAIRSRHPVVATSTRHAAAVLQALELEVLVMDRRRLREILAASIQFHP
jgi:hypothetical protein